MLQQATQQGFHGVRAAPTGVTVAWDWWISLVIHFLHKGPTEKSSQGLLHGREMGEPNTATWSSLCLTQGSSGSPHQPSHFGLPPRTASGIHSPDPGSPPIGWGFSQPSWLNGEPPKLARYAVHQPDRPKGGAQLCSGFSDWVTLGGRGACSVTCPSLPPDFLLALY